MQASLADYALRIAFRVGPRGRTRRVHVTFVKEVVWDPLALERFDATRAYLMRVDGAARRMRAVARELECAARDHGAVHLSLAADATGKVHVRLRPRAFAGITTRLEWRHARDRLRAELNAAPVHCGDHPAVEVSLDARGEVVGVDVKAEYLEKSHLRVWTLAELREVCEAHVDSGGSMNPWVHPNPAVSEERFRPYFIPILKTVCDEFADRRSWAGTTLSTRVAMADAADAADAAAADATANAATPANATANATATANASVTADADADSAGADYADAEPTGSATGRPAMGRGATGGRWPRATAVGRDALTASAPGHAQFTEVPPPRPLRPCWMRT